MANPPSSLLQIRIQQFTDDRIRGQELIALLSDLVQETTELAAIARTGTLQGLELSWVDANTVQVAAGGARDDTDVLTMALASPVSVSLPGDLTPGSSELANTLYHLWLFGDTTGTVSPLVAVDPSDTAPSFPAGTDVARRIGSIRNGPGSGILPFTQAGHSRDRWVVYDARGLLTQVLNNGMDSAFTEIDASAFVPGSCRLCVLRVVYDSQVDSHAVVLRVAGSAEVGNDAVKAGVVLTTQLSTQVQQALNAGRFDYQIQQQSVPNSQADLYVRAYLDQL